MDTGTLMILVKIIIVIWALKDMLEFIAEVLFDIKLTIKNAILAGLLMAFSYIISCNKCLSFHTTLILTGDIFIAAIASIAVRFIDWIWNLLPIKKETRL